MRESNKNKLIFRNTFYEFKLSDNTILEKV